MNTCTVEGCSKEVNCRGYCRLHYRRFMRTGDPLKATNGELHASQRNSQGMKICKGCGEAKPDSEYHKDGASPDGLRARCKLCRSGHMADYYLANRDEKIQYERQRRIKEGDRIRAWEKARYQRDREARMELAEKHGHIRRARIAGTRADQGITVARLRDIHGGSCFYCLTPLDFTRGTRGQGINPTRASIEHLLPLSRGGTHTWDNTVLCCHSCNTRKNNKTVAEYAQYLQEHAA